jgi:RNA polymerase sigma factor (sigma-70 family)
MAIAADVSWDDDGSRREYDVANRRASTFHISLARDVIGDELVGSTWRERAGEAEAVDDEVREALDGQDRARALSLLMGAFGAPIYRYCHRMVGAELVDDVHQLTFVAAYESLDGFRGESSARAWLFAIARHRCLDALRRRRRRAGDDDERGEVASSVSAIDGRLGARDVLEKCFQLLEPRVRDAVILRYQEGYSYPEMAALCGEEPAALQMRVARALPLLRKCIANRSRR